MSLWNSDDVGDWQRALDRYALVVAGQGVKRLSELDGWYREELPFAMQSRTPPFVQRDDLVRITEWKMARGVFRAANLALVKSNPEAEVVDVSRRALSQPNPIRELATLKGVGPATASGVAAALLPDRFAFFDELVAAQIPGLGTVAWTPAYYDRYNAAIRERVEKLGDNWTCVMMERALWSHSGGKARVK